jgi:hypothetical protein
MVGRTQLSLEMPWLTRYRFGTVALILQLIPVLSMVFLLTSAAGSALWAVKLEEQRRLNAAQQAVVITEDEPPPYTDDPI